MLIDLPPVHIHHEFYSMADCQDLFLPGPDQDQDDFDSQLISGGASKTKCDDGLDSDAPLYTNGIGGALRGLPDDALAEPFTYTSSSDSDADFCFSDIDLPCPTRGLAGPNEGAAAADLRIPLSMSPPSSSSAHTGTSTTKKSEQQELALHSPGRLLGTPRDPSRRYEYPFPAHLRVGGDATVLSDYYSSSGASSAVTTPGLTPEESSSNASSSSSLGLVSLATAPTGIASRATTLPIHLLETTSVGSGSGSVPILAPVPVPIPTKTNATGRVPLSNTNTLLAPLAQVSPVAGPSSAPVMGTLNTSTASIITTSASGSAAAATGTTTSIAAHPKLSRFNPADAPVPPGLRGRTRTRNRKSASVSIPGGTQTSETVPVPNVVVAPTRAEAAGPSETESRSPINNSDCGEIGEQ